jgi:isocitrate/isopropylmalate dehydrogenase
MAQGWGEMMPSPDMAMSVRKITRHCSERIARRSFELAMRRRKQVTAIHKANSFHMTDELFLECVRRVAKDFPEVKLNDLLVDARPRTWCATPSASTCWWPRTFTATSSPTSPESSRAASDSPAR